MTDYRHIRSLTGILLCVLLIACTSNKHYNAAPLGQKSTLEKLADAYRKNARALPVSPPGLTPAARRKFLEQTFHDAGFDYSATLMALAKVPQKDINQYHKDLKQLLYLPHFDNRLNHLSDVYSKEEISAIETIDKKFN